VNVKGWNDELTASCILLHGPAIKHLRAMRRMVKRVSDAFGDSREVEEMLQTETQLTIYLLARIMSSIMTTIRV